MQELVGQSRHPFLLEGVYYARKANACAIAERFDECENFLHAARVKTIFVKPCTEVLLIIVFEVIVRLFRFENNPTKDERRSLLKWAQEGLGCTENTDLDSACFNKWRRSFILRMVFCLLGLGNKGKVIKCHIDDVQKASELLDDVKKHWNGIEVRRKMFYYLARARIADLIEQLPDCEFNLQLALVMASIGRFEEIKHLARYIRKIWEIHRLRSCTPV